MLMNLSNICCPITCIRRMDCTNTMFERSNITFQLEKTPLSLPLVHRAALCCRPSTTPGEGEAMHRETVEISLKDKTPCGVPQDSLVSLAGSKSLFFLHTMKYRISVSHGPGDGNWGAELARCQLHSSSSVSCSPLT